jgi:hypothetical protein
MAPKSKYMPVGLNLLVLPGLGTWVAGRRLSGTLQILMAVTGFGLAFAWFVQLITLYGRMDDFPDFSALPYRWLIAGVVLFAGAWLWSLASSLAMLRRAHGSRPPIWPTS